MTAQRLRRKRWRPPGRSLLHSRARQPPGRVIVARSVWAADARETTARTAPVIAFGACIASREKFLRYAMPGISLVAEPDSEIAEVTTEHSIFEAYNEVLEAFAGRKGSRRSFSFTRTRNR